MVTCVWFGIIFCFLHSESENWNILCMYQIKKDFFLSIHIQRQFLFCSCKYLSKNSFAQKQIIELYMCLCWKGLRSPHTCMDTNVSIIQSSKGTRNIATHKRILLTVPNNLIIKNHYVLSAIFCSVDLFEHKIC